MAYRQTFAPIVQKEALAKHIFRFELFCPELVSGAAPGQFVHILPPGCTLRRPISICTLDAKRGKLTIAFEAKGPGTDALSNLCVGQNMDLLGPLGHGFTLYPEAKHVILVGGGIGNPPMLSLAQAYGNRATAICGFRSANCVILQNAFSKTGSTYILCTDDGTAGQHGFVTEPLKNILNTQTVNCIYACGPRPMLKSVAQLAMQNHIPCEISMEEHMACGIGACLGCAIPLQEDGKQYMGHVCKDGPVFAAEEVIW